MFTVNNDLPQNAAYWKKLGNDHYINKNFREAIKAYTNGIKHSPEEEIVLFLNRSAACLNLGQYSYALQDLSVVMSKDPKNIKGQFRSGEAFYGLCQYNKALEIFEKLRKTDKKNKNCIEMVAKTKERLFEQGGKYDFSSMVEEAKKNPRLDRASYIGPVEIKKNETAQRGLHLTRNVQPGELLLLCKSLDIILPSESPVVIEKKIGKTTFKGPSTYYLHQKILQKLEDEPSLAEDFFNLYAGQSRMGDKYDPNGMIDSSWVGDIINYNSFSLDSTQEGKIFVRPSHFDLSGKTLDNPSGIWIFPSYINHDCIGNCTRSFIGDMMIIRANQRLKRGDEILISYTEPLSSYPKRMAKLLHYDIICSCELCRLDSSDQRMEKIEEMAKYFEDNLSSVTHATVHDPSLWEKNRQEIVALVEKMKKQYGDRKYLRLYLRRPLSALAFLHQVAQDLRASIDYHLQQIEADKGENYSLIAIHTTLGLVQLSMLHYSLGRVAKADKYLEEAKITFSITTGRDEQMFREQYREQFEMVGKKI